VELDAIARVDYSWLHSIEIKRERVVEIKQSVRGILHLDVVNWCMWHAPVTDWDFESDTELMDMCDNCGRIFAVMHAFVQLIVYPARYLSKWLLQIQMRKGRSGVHAFLLRTWLASHGHAVAHAGSSVGVIVLI
jgi:hypothetical protein